MRPGHGVAQPIVTVMLLSVTTTEPLPPTPGTLAPLSQNVSLLLVNNLNRPVLESTTEYSILSTVGVEGGPA